MHDCLPLVYLQKTCLPKLQSLYFTAVYHTLNIVCYINDITKLDKVEEVAIIWVPEIRPHLFGASVTPNAFLISEEVSSGPSRVSEALCRLIQPNFSYSMGLEN